MVLIAARKRMTGLANSQFVRNVAAVASGSAASQAITIAFAPFITRLYGPEAYGLQSLFFSVVGLMGTVAALGYPTAIVLPRNDADALGLVRLSMYVGFGMAVLCAVLLAFVGKDILRVLNAQAVSTFVFLIPMALFVSVLCDILAQWLIRTNAFMFSARFTVFTSILVNSVKSGMGIINPSAMVLISTSIAGSALGTALTYFVWKKKSPAIGSPIMASASPEILWQLAKQYSDFPLLRTPQNLINAFSQSLPVLLLAAYFGASVAGQYAIAIAVLAMPVSLIGGSVMSVFYPRVNEAICNGEDARTLIVKATVGMAVIGVVPFIIVAVAGPSLFEFVFGQDWSNAGVYAQWLSVWIFFQYINKPAVSAIPALKLQGGLLVYEFFSTGTKILALWAGFALYRDAVKAIAFFSIVGSIAYIWLMLWVVSRCGQQHSLKGRIS